MIIGREAERAALERMYRQDGFQMCMLYGRSGMGKTALLNEFCRDRDAIFFCADRNNLKGNLDKFSEIVFQHYGEQGLAPFQMWDSALSWLQYRQGDRRLIVVLDDFPYLVENNRELLFAFQHCIDRVLQTGQMFLILCGSSIRFMEKEVLSPRGPLHGRQTGELHLKPLDSRTALQFLPGFSPEEQLSLLGILGATPLWLKLVQPGRSLEDNICGLFLDPASLLYREPQMQLKEELRKPAVYHAILEAIARGAYLAGEISDRTGEKTARCLKYIRTLCEMGILKKEMPFGEPPSTRRSRYRFQDPMFRFWFRYVFPNRTLLETGKPGIVWRKRIQPDLHDFMGPAFERICMEYLLQKNGEGDLPLLFTDIGRWWGTDPATRTQTEIDLVAKDGSNLLFCECKWRNRPTDIDVLSQLQRKADIFRKQRGETWFGLFSLGGFTPAVCQAAEEDPHILLWELPDLIQ